MFPNLFTFSSVGAEIKRARPDLLKDIEIGREDGIPPDMPSDFLEKHDKKYHVEGIGEPITACFLTGMKVDPTKWYPYTSPHSSPSHNPHLILVLSASLGGYLKNMMGYVRFGILWRRHSFLDLARDILSPMIWWPKCLEIFSWMANSGKNINLFIYLCILFN